MAAAGSPIQIAAARRKAHRAAFLMHRRYGSPNHNNKADPLDELIFIILSLMTTAPSFNRVYDRLKQSVETWDKLLVMPLAKFKRLIKDAGLSNQKAPRIKAILRKIRVDFGYVSLDPLKAMSNTDATNYLMTLPSVGEKAAKCVLMYCLHREVLPVDTHVWRVARRIGLITEGVPYTKVHTAIETVVAPKDRYAFHVNAVALGQDTCLALRPRCSACCLQRICRYYNSIHHTPARS